MREYGQFVVGSLFVYSEYVSKAFDRSNNRRIFESDNVGK